MQYNLRDLVVLVAMVAICFTVRTATGVGASIAISLMYVSLFFGTGIGAIFCCFLALVLTRFDTAIGVGTWLVLSGAGVAWSFYRSALMVRDDQARQLARTPTDGSSE